MPNVVSSHQCLLSERMHPPPQPKENKGIHHHQLKATATTTNKKGSTDNHQQQPKTQGQPPPSPKEATVFNTEGKGSHHRRDNGNHHYSKTVLSHLVPFGWFGWCSSPFGLGCFPFSCWLVRFSSPLLSFWRLLLLPGPLLEGCTLASLTSSFGWCCLSLFCVVLISLLLPFLGDAAFSSLPVVGEAVLLSIWAVQLSLPPCCSLRLPL